MCRTSGVLWFGCPSCTTITRSCFITNMSPIWPMGILDCFHRCYSWGYTHFHHVEGTLFFFLLVMINLNMFLLLCSPANSFVIFNTSDMMHLQRFEFSAKDRSIAWTFLELLWGEHGYAQSAGICQRQQQSRHAFSAHAIFPTCSAVWLGMSSFRVSMSITTHVPFVSLS